MDFPSSGRFHKPTICTISQEAGTWAAKSAPAATSAWNTANLAVFVPFTIAVPYLVTKLFWTNGTTASGSLDCGIYSLGGALLTSTGSTVQGTISVVQSVTLGTALTLEPGSYYMALAASSATATVVKSLPNFPLAMLGLAQQATAFPLPASFTLATAPISVPLFGIGHPVVI